MLGAPPALTEGRSRIMPLLSTGRENHGIRQLRRFRLRRHRAARCRGTGVVEAGVAGARARTRRPAVDRAEADAEDPVGAERARGRRPRASRSPRNRSAVRQSLACRSPESARLGAVSPPSCTSAVSIGPQVNESLNIWHSAIELPDESVCPGNASVSEEPRIRRPVEPVSISKPSMVWHWRNPERRSSPMRGLSRRDGSRAYADGTGSTLSVATVALPPLPQPMTTTSVREQGEPSEPHWMSSASTPDGNSAGK